ncbi:hypothetical protein P8631_21940, partial [Guyparkeria sp. 1SP6A2]|nr:hypothetical protein [Guyparkeria sp. 1SP6A2]
MTRQHVLETSFAYLPVSMSEMARMLAYFPIAITRLQQRWSMVILLDDKRSLAQHLPTDLPPYDDTTTGYRYRVYTSACA